MGNFCGLIWCAVVGLFRSRAALQAEIFVLRHQLQRAAAQGPEAVGVQRHRSHGICWALSADPWCIGRLEIIKPETVIRWHRAGFRAYWRWKSRPRGGRPRTPADIRQLIREMSAANPFWGAPRIHGELLKLGID